MEKKKANTGALAAAKRILDREGIVGLYAGMESALFGITVTNFVYYYCECRELRCHEITSLTNAQGMSSPGHSS